MHKETQAISYLTSSAFVQFDYPIAFDITMHKKGSKYVKKNFVIKLHEWRGNNKTNNGRVKIDFSQIPVLKKPIIRREVPLQHCSDKGAVACISVKLEEVFKPRGNNSQNSSLLSPSSSVVRTLSRPDEKLVDSSRKSLGDPLAVKPNEDGLKNKVKEPVNTEPKQIPVEIVDVIEDEQETPGRSDSFSSKMSFSDLILNPNASEISSEESSEEEEAKELPVERLVSHSMPKVTRDQVTPNEGSKASHISKLEAQNGITTRREGNCCTACNIQ